jgi:hypothetical protein
MLHFAQQHLSARQLAARFGLGLNNTFSNSFR